MRAAICARVSSDKQREEKTIDTQIRVLTEYFAQMGWDVGRIYIDDGQSAKSGNLAKRTDFVLLLADVADRQWDVIGVMNVDRLTRAEDLTERGMILGTFQRGGCKIASPSGGILDLETSAGDLMGSFHAFAAAEWLRIHRARVKAGKLTSIARGRKPSGPTPYGYRYDRATHAWSVDDAQAAIVREIVTRVGAGETCHALAADLNTRGIARPRGGRWAPEAVWQIARSPTFLGKWTAIKTRRLTVPVPRIVADDEHAQALAALRRHRRRGLDRTQHVYLIDRLATCGRCGAAIGIASAITPRTPGHRGGRRLPVPSRYVCCLRRRAHLRANPAERCGLPYHATADVDAALWVAIVDVVTDAAIVERAVRALRDAPAVDPRIELARCQAEIARLDRSEAAVLERHARGTITDAGLDTHLARLATVREEARRSLAAAEVAARGARVALAAVDGLVENLARFRAVCEAADPTARRELVRILVDEVTIGDRAVWASLHLPATMLGLSDPVGLVSDSGYNSPAWSLPLQRVAVAIPARKRAA